MKQEMESGRAPLVAVVDDDESLRESAGMLVRSLGFRSESFARGRDFLEWPRLDEVSCVVLDVLMPDMDGIELQRRLMQTHPLIPIVFITAHAEEREERRAMAAGAVAMLRKPVGDGILLEALRRALQARGVPGAGGASGARSQKSMNSERDIAEPTAASAEQALFELELRIARRADELAMRAPAIRNPGMEFWLRAEREVLAD